MDDGTEGSTKSKFNVQFLKTNSGARYQGYQFFFREGFCWTDINSTFLKARLKNKGVFDVVSMSLFSQVFVPDWYFVCLINTKTISFYVDNFINNTSHFQINDARQLPVIIPTTQLLEEIKLAFEKAVHTKKQMFNHIISDDAAELQLNLIQQQLNCMIDGLYGI